MHCVTHLPLLCVCCSFGFTARIKKGLVTSSADRVNHEVSCKIFCMCLWTRLRLSISKRLKSRVLVSSLYAAAFSVVFAQEPIGTSLTGVSGPASIP